MLYGWCWLIQKYRVIPVGNRLERFQSQSFGPQLKKDERSCCERYLRCKGACLEAVRVTCQVTIITLERSLSLSNAFLQDPVPPKPRFGGIRDREVATIPNGLEEKVERSEDAGKFT